MKAPSVASRLLIVVVATLLLALSGSLAWAAVNDFQTRGVVPPGVTVAGRPLGGLTSAGARAVIEEAVAAPLLRPIAVQAAGREFSLDPKTIVTVDVDGMLSAAYAPRRTAPFVLRVHYDLTGAVPATEVAPAFTLDQKALATWVSAVASQIDSAPVSADMKLVDGAVVVTRSAAGRRLDASGTIAALTSALDAEKALSDEASRSVSIPVLPVAPKVTEKSFGKALVVDLSQRSISLFNGLKLEKAYPCAIGTPGHPTPKGAFKIVGKRYMPTWRNPGSAWAKSMPAYIGPGPGNPLGTRALNLDASGIRIHGTSSNSSIGTAASHGCMRMHMWDVEDLYPRVPIGTPVFVVR